MSATSREGDRFHLRFRSIVVAVLIALGLGGVAWFWAGSGFRTSRFDSQAEATLLERARQALDGGRDDLAGQFAKEVLAARPDSPGAHLLLGRLAAGRNDMPAALEHFAAVPASAGDLHEQALLETGVACLADDRLQLAETKFRELIDRDPTRLDARRQLVRLLTLTGRRRQATPHLQALVRADAFELEHLFMLADPDSVIDFSADLERALRRHPNDPLARVGLARIAHQQGDPSKALALIRDAVKLMPHDAAAQATWGRLLVELEPARFTAWHSSLPRSVASHPEILAVMGQFAEAQGDNPAAIRCYGEAVTGYPGQRRWEYRLGQLLATQGRAAEARPLLARAALLDELIGVVDVLLRQPHSRPHLVRAAEITEQLGRSWEAQAWYAVLADVAAGSDYRQKRHLIRSQLTADSPFESANPLRHIDLALYPAPEWQTDAGSADGRPAREVARPPALLLRDVAAQQGLDFSYFSGDDPAVAGWEIFQELGGGVGVIDFDRDGWPDLYFPQGCAWPPSDIDLPGETRTSGGAASQPSDRLFRNCRGAAAEDVTEKAFLADDRYGQGVAIGDWDNDGFSDIYVANLGVNRLYRNQGDGTFLDVTDTAASFGRMWTTSCAIADLSGDGLPDLFDATYLAGDDPLVRRCIARGIRRACSPDQFSGEQDRLYVNLGDGRFSEAGAAAGITGFNGKGLGLVVADFHGQGRLSLFVANDGTPNFYYVNQAARGQPPAFVERAITSGLAVNGEGRSQACMGVAIDDVEQNGGWDLFVTNLHREGGVFYRQRAPDLFEDRTRAAELLQPTLPFTGFGTQLVDLTLDGWSDLVILNGHIEDFRYRDVPFRMRAQAFLGGEGGGFTQAEGRVGEYFEREQLGRALAALDWNRDGRPDLVATHLDFPAALLLNDSPQTGGFLKVYLAGEASSRDAIGTVVELRTAAGRTLRKQLVAGDGFQASNERVLHFGLGSAAGIAELRVRWPSGEEQRWSGLEADREIILRESGDLFVLTREDEAPRPSAP